MCLIDSPRWPRSAYETRPAPQPGRPAGTPANQRRKFRTAMSVGGITKLQFHLRDWSDNLREITRSRDCFSRLIGLILGSFRFTVNQESPAGVSLVLISLIDFIFIIKARLKCEHMHVEWTQGGFTCSTSLSSREYMAVSASALDSSNFSSALLISSSGIPPGPREQDQINSHRLPTFFVTVCS